MSFSVTAADFLSEDQAKAALSGKTLTWEHMIKNKSGKTFYAEDGSLKGISNGSPREGKWHMDGNKVCVSWSKCLPIEADGNGGYYKVKNGSKRVVHITKAEDGNTL